MLIKFPPTSKLEEELPIFQQDLKFLKTKKNSSVVICKILALLENVS